MDRRRRGGIARSDVRDYLLAQGVQVQRDREFSHPPMTISIDALKNLMKCDHCRQFRTQAGHDPCIADLPGVRFACCGHGGTDGFMGSWSLPYVVEKQEPYMYGEGTWYGDAALERMRELGGNPPDHPGPPSGARLSKYVMERMSCQ